MKTRFACKSLGVLALVIQTGLISFSVQASSGGSGAGERGGSTGSGKDNIAFEPAPAGDAQAGEGFGASPKAVAAWEAAGGKAGTGKSFQDWLTDALKDMAGRQDGLTWDATKAAWSASFWSVSVGAAASGNALGQASQFGLHFVPGIGKLTHSGPDAARGAAEGYAEAVDKGMSQKDVAKTGASTAQASGLFSAFMSKLGLAKDAGAAVKATMVAKTAKQIIKTDKALGTAFVGTTVHEAIKTIMGDVDTTSVVNNSSPRARTYKESAP